MVTRNREGKKKWDRGGVSTNARTRVGERKREMSKRDRCWKLISLVPLIEGTR